LLEALNATKVQALEEQLNEFERQGFQISSGSGQVVTPEERIAALEAKLEERTTEHAAALADQQFRHTEATQNMQAELQEAQRERDIERARNTVLTEQVEKLVASQAATLYQAEDAVLERDAAVEKLEEVMRSQRRGYEYANALQKASELAGPSTVASDLASTPARAVQVCEHCNTPDCPRRHGSSTVETVDTGPVEHSVSRAIVEVAHAGDLGVRLKKAGARVGALTCSLLWNNTDDLDLHCEGPMGDHIHWNQKRGTCGGHLDVDMHATDKNLTQAPVENMYWDRPPPGKYKFWIENKTVREDSATPFTVRLTKDGKAEDKHFEDLPKYETQTAFEFEIPEP
jgi:hypothetical protein